MIKPFVFSSPTLRINFSDVEGLDISRIRKTAREKNLPGVNISYYRGVHWSRDNNKWKAAIDTERKQEYIGLFESEIEAPRTYDKVARYIFGDKAKTNFNGTEKLSLEKIRKDRHPFPSYFRGVSFRKDRNVWHAYIKSNGKRIFLGNHESEAEAALAYNREAAKLGRPLNIIPENVEHAL